MQQKQTVLFSPLNWGLGHATRMVPLINQYKNNGDRVVLAANGKAYGFFKHEFPGVELVYFKGVNIKYAPKPFFWTALLLQAPLFIIGAVSEHFRLKKMVIKTKPGLIISDNRYGLFHPLVKSVLVTHQLHIQTPFFLKPFKKVIHFFTRKAIEKFDECWIPDYPEIDNSLAGKLSHGPCLPANAKYIGPISRFKNMKNNPVYSHKKYSVLSIISGPEPYRTIFERQIEKRYSGKAEKVLMVCGKPKKRNMEPKKQVGNIIKTDHLPTKELYEAMMNAKKIIARAGYSTIMDLHVLKLKAELHATPGQSEQEYLVNWINRKVTD